MDLSRSVPILSEEGIAKLNKSHVIVFGVGGVGSYALEALVRCGVGNLTIYDFDIVSPTNINRQLIATTQTMGKAKTDVAIERALSINPQLNIVAITQKFTADTQIDFSNYDYVLDCIDGIDAKVHLILSASESSTPIISATGMGNRIDNTKLVITDLYNTSYCPLARLLRQRLKKSGVLSHTVVTSTEIPIHCDGFVSSVSFVPSTAGLLMAGYVIRQLIGK